MVDFRLTEEQNQYQQLARDFARREITPKASHYDQTGEFPLEVYRKAWELGLMNVQIPEQYGGLGLNTFDACLIAEAIASGCTGIAAAMEANNLALAPVLLVGSEQQKEEFVRPMTEQCSFAAYCGSEFGAGAKPEEALMVARLVGDEYVISGKKMSVINASTAKWYYLLAATSASAGYKGMSAFIVPSETLGITVHKPAVNLGRRGSDTGNITFEDVKIPVKYLLGEAGQGYEYSSAAFDYTCPLLASAAVGLAHSAMEHSIQYAKQRTTFGQPIANHQAVSFMLADMAKDIEAARLLVWQAAWLIDNNMKSTTEALMAKAFAVDVAMRVATDAVQIFGGYGYSREYPVEKLMRDAKNIQIYQGTSPRHRVRIGRDLVQV